MGNLTPTTSNADKEELWHDALPVAVCRSHGRFESPFSFATPFANVLKWKATSSPATPPSQEEILIHLPVHLTDTARIVEYAQRDRPRLIWIGHATFVIQIGGFTVLTDPVWSQHVSPLQQYGLGYKRFIGTPFPLEEIIDKIDAVIVSHNHFDHLDVGVVQAIGNKAVWIVPMNLRNWLIDNSIAGRVQELDWWKDTVIEKIDTHDSTIRHKLRITFAPAKHWSGRSGIDSNSTLWGSYILETASEATTSELTFPSSVDCRVFFAGDTGFDERLFESIHSRFPHFDVGIIPIGAYKPRWMMCAQHINPREAVLIHRILQCRQSIGMHWGTFALADEGLFEAPIALAHYRGHDDDTFFTLTVGQIWPFGASSIENMFATKGAIADPHQVYFGDMAKKFPDMLTEFDSRIDKNGGWYVDGDDEPNKEINIVMNDT